MSSDPPLQTTEPTKPTENVIKPKQKKGIQGEFDNPFYGTRKGQELYFRRLAGKK